MPSDSTSTSNVWDSIIVGAGISGLSAGSVLAKAGHRVLVLEARSRIGGRIHTYEDDLPCAIDLGASFIHGIDGNPLVQLAREQNLRLHGRFEDAAIGFAADGRLIPEDVAERVAGAVFTTIFDHSRKASNNQLSPLNKSLSDYLFDPSSPLYQGLESDREKDYATQVAEGFDGWTGAALDRISFRFWGFEREFQGHDVIVADGYHSLLTPLQDDILRARGSVALGEQVLSITFNEDAQTVSISTKSGHFEAKSCICTIPLGVLKHSPPKFEPPLPPRRLSSIGATGFGLLNKVVISYPHLWWPKEAGILHILQKGIQSQVPDALGQRALFVIPYQAITHQPVICLLVGGRGGEALEGLSNADAGAWLHGVLKRCLLSLPDAPDEAPEPNAVVVTRWLSDPYARGSYAYIPPMDKGMDSQATPPSPLDLIELSRPLWGNRLGFAGEHTEVDHYASVHGALLSGWREGNRVKAALEGQWAETRRESL